MKLRDKVVAITGAGSGIGRALALAVARSGARVAGLDLHHETMDETAALVRAAGGQCLSFSGDVGKPDVAPAFLAAVLAEYGVVDVLINNAGIIQPFVPFSRMTLAQVERVFDVNWRGVVHMTHAFLPSLKARPVAHLVNVSSMGGLCPVPGQGVYGASKAAVKLFSESLALELKGTSVKVTTVLPGGVKTNITANAPDISDAEKKAQLEKGKERLTVGADSALVDKLARLSPKRVGTLMALLMERAGIHVTDAG